MINFQITVWHALAFLGALLIGLGWIIRWYLISLKLGREIRGTADHRKVSIADQPLDVNATVKKQSRRYDHDLAEARHSEISKRVDGHDAEIDKLWDTMRAEDADIREKNAEEFKEIANALGRIEGHLGTKRA